MKDVEEKVENNMVQINDFLKNLPTITVKGKSYRFVNGIGYGIDGMCCEVADKMRAQGKENISYAGISIKLLIHGYKCPNAKVTVDGKVYNYKKMWLAVCVLPANRGIRPIAINVVNTPPDTPNPAAAPKTAIKKYYRLCVLNNRY